MKHKYKIMIETNDFMSEDDALSIAETLDRLGFKSGEIKEVTMCVYCGEETKAPDEEFCSYNCFRNMSE